MPTFDMTTTIDKYVQSVSPGKARTVNVYDMKTYYAALIEVERFDLSDCERFTDTFIMRFDHPSQILSAVTDDEFVEFFHC